MSMQRNQEKAQEIKQVTGLKMTHFCDLVRVAQLIYDPGGGVSGITLEVDWLAFGIQSAVVDNLRSLGKKYQYEMPHVDIDKIWAELSPETRSWFIAHKSNLWQIEEAFPALDED